MELKSIHNDAKIPKVIKVDLNIEKIDKGGYEHYMLKEIHEQPTSIADTFRGRIALDKSKIF